MIPNKTSARPSYILNVRSLSTDEFNKLTKPNCLERLKKAHLGSKNDIADFIKRADLMKR